MEIKFKTWLLLALLLMTGSLLACGLSPAAPPEPGLPPTATLALAQFSTPVPPPTVTSVPQPTPSPTLTSSPTPTPTEPAETPPPSPTSTATATPDPLPAVEPSSVAQAAAPTVPLPPTEPPPPEPAPAVDFVVRLVKMRSNQENSWDGTLNGVCGSDHSIYVRVADAQENLLNGVLVGDRYGNFEVPTGVDGPGLVRILVWSATMELAVMGHQDGTRYTSEFSVPLSTLDHDIPLDWLQQGGYCQSPEDCQQRVETNQLCHGHYSYDLVFQRTW